MGRIYPYQFSNLLDARVILPMALGRCDFVALTRWYVET